MTDLCKFLNEKLGRGKKQSVPDQKLFNILMRTPKYMTTEDLFNDSDESIMRLRGIGRKQLQRIRELQEIYEKEQAHDRV